MSEATQATNKNIFELPPQPDAAAAVEPLPQDSPLITEHEQQDAAALKAIDEARAEEEQAEAYFKSQYDKHLKVARRAAKEGFDACAKLEALATLSGKNLEQARSIRSNFKRCVGSIPAEDE